MYTFQKKKHPDVNVKSSGFQHTPPGHLSEPPVNRCGISEIQPGRVPSSQRPPGIRVVDLFHIVMPKEQLDRQISYGQ